jgi:Pyruvate/2-oxoacid:ferredoxin oxidoreductase delta subunit
MTNDGCSVDGCTKPHLALGLCSAHYQRRRKGRNLTGALRVQSPALTRDEQGRKRCSDCGGWKPEAGFHVNTRATDGLYTYCKECVRLRQQCKIYSITRAQYDELLAAQNGGCAICGVSGVVLSVDHDHSCCDVDGRSCGKCVRGLLCNGCNIAIGHMRDNPARLRAAADYLERPHSA